MDLQPTPLSKLYNVQELLLIRGSATPFIFQNFIIFRSCFLLVDLQPLPLSKLYNIQELLLISGSATPSSSKTSLYSGVASYYCICNLFQNFIVFRSYFLLWDPLPRDYNIPELLLIMRSATHPSSQSYNIKVLFIIMQD